MERRKIPTVIFTDSEYAQSLSDSDVDWDDLVDLPLENPGIKFLGTLLVLNKRLFLNLI